jgi:predicted dehydrogenase
MNRRSAIKSIGTLGLGVSIAPSLGKNLIESEYSFPVPSNHIEIDKPVTAIVIGAGNRGNTYAGYSKKYGTELKIVGVAEPIELRKERFSEKYEIPKNQQFATWEDVFKVKKFADVCIITTPDHLHHGPAMAAMQMGYHLLLEKPIAQSWEECRDILKQSKKTNNIVAVCHVLRYTPYFRKMKDVVQSGVLGDLVSIQHLEPVEHIHMSHSFVRGNWRKTSESNPIILAKSCHDMDILRWVIDKNAKEVHSFGSLKLFKKENAPEGSTLRCTDGCKVEATCPYSALRIYHRKRIWLHHFDLPTEGDKGDAIMQNLIEGPYGRCVYQCDNDVNDHQVTNFLFDEEITAAFSLEALTSYWGRRTRIMGTMGDLVGDETDLIVNNFRTDETTKWNIKDNATISSGHGGGDYGLVSDFVQAVFQKNPAVLTSTIDASMESHLMAFKAEESRKNHTVSKIDINL